MTTGRAADRWSGGDAYDRFMGRWSRELARAFVRWLDVPESRHWLDVGCGTGALTGAIAELAVPASVVAVDPSESYAQHARAVVADPRVRFAVGGVGSLPPRPGGYDAIASSLVLNFLPDPAAALAEMRALAAPEGVVAAAVWDYGDGMQFLRYFWDAAVELDPSARESDEGRRFPICSAAALEAAFRQGGFGAVTVEALEVPTRFRDFEDYWTPFVGGPGPAPGYLASLPEERQAELRERLDATLPRDADGSIRLFARAWAGRAESPS